MRGFRSSYSKLKTDIMKKPYITPEVEIVEVAIEKGFAGSDIETPGMGGNHGWGRSFGE